MKGLLTVLLALALFAVLLPSCARRAEVYYTSPDHGIRSPEID
jgi:hypothetical protein